MWNFARICKCFIALIVVFSFPSQSKADFPDRPINLIVPFSPGGMVDLLVRVLAKPAEKQLGQPLVIQNKEGGGGSVGLGFLATVAKPDGYTIGASIPSIFTVAPQMREVPYKLEDFAPILGYTTGALGICVKPDSPWKTYEEFIDYAKKNPGAVSYGTPGTGTLNHLAMEWLGKRHGIKWTHIPFKGNIPSITALLGGHLQAVHAATEAFPYVDSGKLRLLIVTTGRRLERFPNIPDIREKEEGYYVKSVLGLVAPRGVAKPVLQKLEAAFKKATEDESFIQTCKNMGLPAFYVSGEECAKIYKELAGEYTILLKELGLYMKKP
jgi:tripartite-type tricarboxylate transporter receptor subunit TctC